MLDEKKINILVGGAPGHRWVPPLGPPAAVYVPDRVTKRLRLVAARLPGRRLMALQAALDSRNPGHSPKGRGSTSTRVPGASRGRYAKSA